MFIPPPKKLRLLKPVTFKQNQLKGAMTKIPFSHPSHEPMQMKTSVVSFSACHWLESLHGVRKGTLGRMKIHSFCPSKTLLSIVTVQTPPLLVPVDCQSHYLACPLATGGHEIQAWPTITPHLLLTMITVMVGG